MIDCVPWRVLLRSPPHFVCGLRNIVVFLGVMILKIYIYIYIYIFFDQVLAARRAVLGHLHDLGGKLDGTQPWEDGVLLQGCGAGCVPFMEGRQPLAEHDPAKRDTVMKVLEGRR